MNLLSADNLRVYNDGRQGVIVMEYEVHGTRPDSETPYNNRFCSIITIKDRKVVHWRDYMDLYPLMS